MPVYTLESTEDSAVPFEKKPTESVGEAFSNPAEGAYAPEVNAERAEGAKENSYEKVLKRAQTQGQENPSSTSDAKTVADDAQGVVSVEEELRIQKLVQIALEKGPEHAFRVAVELDDMYVLDRLHDKLSHQLYEELLSKGFLKSE